MRKPLLIGGGLGLLVLALLAGSFWLAGNNAQTTSTTPARASVGQRVSPLPPSSSPAGQTPSVAGGSSAAFRSPQEAQERRRRLAEVRAEFNALRAQGVNASPERMLSLVNELEALAPPGFDPRYYQALRKMLESSARIQVLNKELQTISKSTSPRDLERQKVLMDEMRALGERVGAEARNLQTYAPKPGSGAKTP